MDRLSGRFLAAVLFQFVILGSVIGYKQYTVWTGETVTLKVLPLDPRSPFSGDYVRLTYEISTLDLARLAGDDFIGDRQTVYVELAPAAGGLWQAVAVYRDRRTVPEGHVLIKGKTEDSRFGDPTLPVRITYGIEDIYVPEGSGSAVQAGGDRLTVEVKVDRFGNAVPRRLLIDGRPLNLQRR